MANGATVTYAITTTWDNQTIDHAPIQLTLTGQGTHLELVVSGPFFNDPPGPDGPPGEAYWGLWNYEVAEAFFLGSNDRYLEVELCPHGQHLLLMLNGKNNDVGDCLPLNFSATIDGSTWEGRAYIPQDYFPPNVTKFNGYAIHGSGDARQYESLYPCPQGEYPGPDFHRLEYFQPIDFGALMPDNPNSDLSQIWQDALAGQVSFPCNGK